MLKHAVGSNEPLLTLLTHTDFSNTRRINSSVLSDSLRFILLSNDPALNGDSDISIVFIRPRIESSSDTFEA